MDLPKFGKYTLDVIERMRAAWDAARVARGAMRLPALRGSAVAVGELVCCSVPLTRPYILPHRPRTVQAEWLESIQSAVGRALSSWPSRPKLKVSGIEWVFLPFQIQSEEEKSNV